MERKYFKALEECDDQTFIKLDEFIKHLAFNEAGLIPVIIQDASNKEILMFAWMNQESLELTLTSKRMTYWSRSREQLWIKGETSGHTQALVSMSFDCDGDVILCEVNQEGAACHTGRSSCFYLNVDFDGNRVQVCNDNSS